MAGERPGTPGGPEPTVSVVVRSSSHADYLPGALESVLSQTFDDWECLIVDDGGAEATAATARRLIAENPGRRIGFLIQPNQGLAAARNNAIRAARGRFILPLDAIDYIHPKMLRETVQMLEWVPEAGLAATHAFQFGEQGTVRRLQPYRFPQLTGINTLHYCTLFRKAMWEDAGGYPTRRVGGYTDWDFWIGAGARGWFPAYVDSPLFLSREKVSGRLPEAGPGDRMLRAGIVLNHPELFSRERLELAARIQGEPLSEETLDAQGQIQGQVQQNLNMAWEALGADSLGPAIEALGAALERQAFDARLIGMRAELLRWAGDLDAALGEANRALLADDCCFPALLAKAGVLREQGQDECAEEQILALQAALDDEAFGRGWVFIEAALWELARCREARQDSDGAQTLRRRAFGFSLAMGKSPEQFPVDEREAALVRVRCQLSEWKPLELLDPLKAAGL